MWYKRWNDVYTMTHFFCLARYFVSCFSLLCWSGVFSSYRPTYKSGFREIYIRPWWNTGLVWTKGTNILILVDRPQLKNHPVLPSKGGFPHIATWRVDLRKCCFYAIVLTLPNPVTRLEYVFNPDHTVYFPEYLSCVNLVDTSFLLVVKSPPKQQTGGLD